MVKTKIIGFVGLVVLTGCSYRPTVPIEDSEVETRVRAPASKESAGVQVYSLQNPAVRQLTAQAYEAERNGQFDQAGSYLERALRIDPEDPQLLQHMAEVQLLKLEYQQALNFATRSYDTGPRVGEICSRNWRTISVAREHLQDPQGARSAEIKSRQCMNTRPEGL